MLDTFSLLQSKAWEKLQERLGRTVRRIPGLHTLLVSMPLPAGLCYEYAPHGPAFAEATVGKPSLSGEALHDLAEHTRGTNTVFLRIEPRVADTPHNRGAFAHAGFRRAPDTQPSETMFVDLTKSEEELLRHMEHDTRYAIRAAEKRGVVVNSAAGNGRRAAFAKFWELFEATNARHGLHAYGKRYYEAVAELDDDSRSELFIAEREGETLAGSIVAYCGRTAYYLYAASRAGAGKWNAPSLILWHVIRSAKKQGYAALDLWGASRTKKEWKGWTAFKKSFGGTPAAFVGTWDYVYRPLWYLAYRLASRFR